jgi:hypothetical protein
MARLELTLEIDPCAEPLHGYLRVADAAEPHEFSGWIELVHALETVLEKSGGDPRREAEPRE